MTIDRDKVWTGELNQRRSSRRRTTPVGLYDTTLRDGEQSVGVVLSPEDKLEIARALDDAGVDRIEAGFPRVSEEDCAGDAADRRRRAAGRDLGVRARRRRRTSSARRAGRAVLP